jgi:hypothetical protein
MAEMYSTMIKLGEQLYIATRALLVSKGVKPNSDVYRSVEIQAKNDLITFLANDYLIYVSTGRKAGGKKVPIRFLLEFIKQNNMKGKPQKNGKPMTDNQLAFAIQTMIYRRGIRGKNFYDLLTKMFEDMGSETISNDAEQKIMNYLMDLKLN